MSPHVLSQSFFANEHALAGVLGALKEHSRIFYAY